MFKLYQVVHGEACLAGYSARGKLPLLHTAKNLPSGFNKRTEWEKLNQSKAYVNGVYY